MKPARGTDGASSPCPVIQSREQWIASLRNRATALLDSWIKCRAVMQLSGELDQVIGLRREVAAALSLLAGAECSAWSPRFTTYPPQALGDFAAELTKHERQLAEVEKRLGVSEGK